MKKSVFSFCLFFTISISLHAQVLDSCRTGNDRRILQGEYFKCLLLNQADFFWNPGLQLPGYQWPLNTTGTPRHLAFASAIWFGGKDRGTNDVITSVQTYRQGTLGFWPGPIPADNSIPVFNNMCAVWDHIFMATKADNDSLFGAIAQNCVPLSPDQIPYNVQMWPGKGNSFLIDSLGPLAATINNTLAPFVDVNLNGIYEPALGDRPDIGNRLAMAWWVLNDVGNRKTYPYPNDTSSGAGLEYHFTASVYPSRPDAYYLKNSVFMNVKIYNKGSMILDSCHIGTWADLDIGNAVDDMIQCHVMKNLAFSFNGDNDDEGPIGQAPPVFGYKAIDGPVAMADDGIDNNRNGITDEIDEKVLFSNFVYYKNADSVLCGAPDISGNFYTYLRSHWRNGQSMTYDGLWAKQPPSATNKPCKFQFPGDSDPFGFGVGGSMQNPVAMPPWTQTSAGGQPEDQRMMMSAGPFTLLPGSVQEYSFVTLVGFGGTDNLDNINQLYSVSDSLDGLLPLLNPTRASVMADLHDFQLFPNPAAGDVSLTWSVAGSAPVRYEITDISGRVIFQSSVPKTATTKTTIHTGNLDAGFYQVVIYKADGTVSVKRLIKE